MEVELIGEEVELIGVEEVAMGVDASGAEDMGLDGIVEEGIGGIGGRVWVTA